MELRVVPVVLAVLFHGWISATFVPAHFDRKVKALTRILDYIGERTHQMDADVTLGITIAEANIASAISHENARYIGVTHWNLLRSLLIKCDRTRRYLKNEIVPANRNIALLQSVLSDPQVWMRRVSWKKLHPPTAIYSKSNLNHDAIINLTMQGEPKEIESDYCLVQIIRNKLNGICKIPSKCSIMLTKGNRSRGYPLTHKLLIVRVSQAVGCPRMAGIESSDLIREYCSAILLDLFDIDSTGYPENTRDLAMEEIVLCGMEGYKEFITDHYETLILNWSHPSGCYSAFSTRSRGKLTMVRRTSSPTDFGCDSHTTSLAAAFLSLYIRENLENAFN